MKEDKEILVSEVLPSNLDKYENNESDRSKMIVEEKIADMIKLAAVLYSKM